MRFKIGDKIKVVNSYSGGNFEEGDIVTIAQIGFENEDCYGEMTIRIIEYYKNKACELVKGNCDKCEAAYEYRGKKWCCFDATTRFIEWDNQYNT